MRLPHTSSGESKKALDIQFNISEDGNMNPYHQLLDSPVVINGNEHTAECNAGMGIPWSVSTERYQALCSGSTIRERLGMPPKSRKSHPDNSQRFG